MDLNLKKIYSIVTFHVHVYVYAPQSFILTDLGVFNTCNKRIKRRH
jgi:hypothetical protein